MIRITTSRGTKLSSSSYHQILEADFSFAKTAFKRFRRDTLTQFGAFTSRNLLWTVNTLLPSKEFERRYIYTIHCTVKVTGGSRFFHASIGNLKRVAMHGLISMCASEMQI